MKIFILCIFTIILASNLSSEISHQKDIFDDVSSLLEKYQIPGAAIATIDNGEITTIHTIGFADKEKRIAMNANSLFQLASLSKTFTSWGILRLVEKGKIGLEDHIEDHLTQWSHPNEEHRNKITIKMLLSHLSGLSPDSYTGYLSKDPLPSLIESIYGSRNRNTRIDPLYPPGRTFFYSGGNYSLLQLIIEEITELSFHKYMEREILHPMQLWNTSFQHEKIQKDSLCIPYGVFEQPLPFRIYVEVAAAGLYSTIRDAAMFLVENLNTYHSRSSLSLLKHSTLAMMMQDNEFHYGLGYETETLSNGVTLAYHFGANPGWRAGLFLLPAHKAGLVVLTNSDNGKHLILDLAANWVEQKTQVLPSFYSEELTLRHIVRVVLYLVSAGMAFFTFRNILAFKNNLRDDRKGKNWRQFSLWLMLLLGWFFMFYSPYVHPLGWVIGAFMPAGFLYLTQSISFFCVVNILIHLSRNFKTGK